MRERACLLSPIIYFVCTRPGGRRARDSAPASGHPIILFQPPVMANSALLNWAQRGRGRGRGRGDGGRGRGGNHRPLEGAPPPPRQGAYNPQPQKSALPEYFNHEKLGIAKGTCFACGVPTTVSPKPIYGF